MPALLVRPRDVSDGFLVLRDEEVHHLRVRRCQVGDVIEAIDGCGRYYRARLEEVQRHEARALIVEAVEGWGESPVRLHLGVGLIKGQRLDFAVEKATEVGVVSIAPMETRRAVARAGSEHRLDRWQRLAAAAAKQCGRSRVPQVHAPADLEGVLADLAAQCQLVLVGDPGGQGDLHQGVNECRPAEVGLLVGPEGGFAPEELEAAHEVGARSFTWAGRTLRADTAAVVLAALVLDAAERALVG